MTLDDFLRKQDLSTPDFAKLVGASRSQISRVRRGQSRPSWELVERIEAVTSGQVTANDFMRQESAA